MAQVSFGPYKRVQAAERAEPARSAKACPAGVICHTVKVPPMCGPMTSPSHARYPPRNRATKRSQSGCLSPERLCLIAICPLGSAAALCSRRCSSDVTLPSFAVREHRNQDRAGVLARSARGGSAQSNPHLEISIGRPPPPPVALSVVAASHREG